jgi:hypothetical protein
MVRANPIARDLMLAKIHSLITSATKTGGAVWTRREAKLLFERYPESGMNEEEISKVIWRQALERKLPINIAH